MRLSPERPPDAQPVFRLRDLLNLAGALTFSRLGLALAAPFHKYDRRAMLIILLAALLTDVLDGPAARWRGTTSEIGRAADGWIDKIFLVNYGWSMVLAGYATGWHLLAWTIREIVQGAAVPFLAWRYYMGAAGLSGASNAGKAATVLIGVGMLAGLLGVSPVLHGASALGGALGLYSAVDYLVRDFRGSRLGR